MAQLKNLEQPRANALNEDFENERSLSFLERIYLPEIFKALWYTFKEMFKPKTTLEYPEEKWDPPNIFRGRPVLVEDDGKERCVACGLCARSCPPLAISMQAVEDADDPKERKPDFLRSTCFVVSTVAIVKKYARKRPSS